MGGQGALGARRQGDLFHLESRQRVLRRVGHRVRSAKGTTVGKEFRVTRLMDPGRRVQAIASSELGVSRDRLVVPILERSGSVWVLDQIDR